MKPRDTSLNPQGDGGDTEELSSCLSSSSSSSSRALQPGRSLKRGAAVWGWCWRSSVAGPMWLVTESTCEGQAGLMRAWCLRVLPEPPGAAPGPRVHTQGADLQGAPLAAHGCVRGRAPGRAPSRAHPWLWNLRTGDRGWGTPALGRRLGRDPLLSAGAERRGRGGCVGREGPTGGGAGAPRQGRTTSPGVPGRAGAALRSRRAGHPPAAGAGRGGARRRRRPG